MAEERDFRKGEVTRKIHGEDVVQIEWWEVWKRIFENAREKLSKIEGKR